MKRIPCESCQKSLTQPGKICKLCEAAELSLRKFVRKGPMPGPGSIYEAGFRNGVYWERANKGRNQD